MERIFFYTVQKLKELTYGSKDFYLTCKTSEMHAPRLCIHYQNNSNSSSGLFGYPFDYLAIVQFRIKNYR